MAMGGSWNRQRGGLKAKKSGAGFEQRFKEHVESIPGACVIRIEDGCKRIGAIQLIPMPQQFDFIVGIKDRVMFLDTKTTKNNQYSWKITPNSEKRVRRQVAALYSLHKCKQAAGFLIEFSAEFEYRFYPAHLLTKVFDEWKTLKREEGILVGVGFVMNIDFNKILDS